MRRTSSTFRLKYTHCRPHTSEPNWRNHTCGTKLRYNSYYDALYCRACDVWTESGCGYLPPECRCNCATRPAKPSTLKYIPRERKIRVHLRV